MSKLEKLKEKAKGLEARDPRSAIEAWLEVLKTQEHEGDPNPDLSVFNRIGDLYTKVKDPATAADYYDRAVDRYAELGFHNNAIAMCNKVLRNAPARQTTYLKLAKLYAAKGFLAEAKQNFVEYAERMQRAGKLQHAFAALKEFTDISPESDQLRGVLEEHLRMYGEPQRVSSVGAPAPAKPKPPAADLTKSGKHKSSTLVFLDVDAPPVPKAPPGRPSRQPAPPPPSASLIEEVKPEPDTSLEIESTSLVEGLEPTGAGGTVDGLETTQLGYGDLSTDALSVPSLRQEPVADDVEPMAELEPTVPAETDALEPVLDQDLEIEAPAPPPRAPAPPPPPSAKPRVTLPKVAPPKPTLPKVAPPAPPAPQAAPPKVAPVVPRRPGQPAAPQRPTVPRAAPRVEPPKVKPVVPPTRKTVVEVPPLELEPDFDSATTEASHDVDDQPLEVEEAPPAAPRASGFIDIAFDSVEGDQPGSLVFANIEEGPSAPTIEELESRVADDPDDPEGHQALGEALIEEGERERGIQELDHATNGYESHGNLAQAQTLVEEILRLDPNSVRHRQKLVEFAFKAGDKVHLVEAYLELADTLLRQDLPDKARAVYQRVAEHDPKNERAKGALAMLAPAAHAVAAPKTEGRVAPKDAKMKVRADAEAGGDFVDLGAMILEEVPAERDTRMKVEDEEPTGDEERDFQGMLARFRQGIEENIDEADFQSHYDLGIAFKEMGLLDEAIAELQKALRAPEGKLKTSEALGTCFVEKGAHVVAESILRRGLDLPASGDEERLGVLYWLGRALEGQGKRPEARDLYGRVFAVDIRFRDVADRVKALGKAK